MEEEEDEYFWDSLQLVSCKGTDGCLWSQLALLSHFHITQYKYFFVLVLLYKVASQLEVLPGAEFRVAFEEAVSYGGKVILGDRPVQVCNQQWSSDLCL